MGQGRNFEIVLNTCLVGGVQGKLKPGVSNQEILFLGDPANTPDPTEIHK